MTTAHMPSLMSIYPNIHAVLRLPQCNPNRAFTPNDEEVAMEIEWNANQCCHSGNCVRSLPEVFRVENGQFLIQPEKADAARVRETVDACPSKALQIKDD